MGTLKSINADTAGVLSKEEGGFGVDMWAGTSRRMLEKMIDRLPLNVHSPVMRDLMRRLLLSAAKVPEDMPGDGSYVVRRVGILASMGDLVGVNRLLDATPGRTQINALVRFETDNRLLANDNARACALAAGQIGERDSPYWQKIFIYCQALSGEHDKAALGVSLLRETGDADEAFFTLIDALAGSGGKLETLVNPSPLHLSMARVAKVKLPKDVLSSGNPGVLRTVAISPNASIEIRLEAAEIAEQAGALPIDALRQLYTSVSFTEQDLDNPLTRAESKSGPLGRALLYRTSLIQVVPTAQAEAVARALDLAQGGGRYTSSVRVFMPVLKRIPPSAEMAWFAPQAIRAFLIGGEAEATVPWFALLRATASFNKDSRAALEGLLPIVRLAGVQVINEDWGPKMLAQWWGNIRSDENAYEKASLLYSLFDAVGDPVPDEAWEALLDSPRRMNVMLPSTALIGRLISASSTAMEKPVDEVQNEPVDTAAEQQMQPVQPGQPVQPKRNGEIVLLALVVLGEGGPGQADPLVMKQVLISLRAIGLEAEARALALEAAVAAGL